MADEKLNSAHREALALLEIVDDLCTQNQLKYTLASGTLIAYINAVPFSKSEPGITVALLYPHFLKLKEELERYCENNDGFSLHDYTNTEQFETVDLWFVKQSRVRLSESRKKEEFYYGTRLVISPVFYAGTTQKEWKDNYKKYRLAMRVWNARAVLPKKPLRSYVKMTKRRVTSNYLRKKRGMYAIGEVVRGLAANPESKYVLYSPAVINKKKAAFDVTAQIWQNVKRIHFSGVACYVAVEAAFLVEKCFSQETIALIAKQDKSQLLLNGCEDLRRVQLIQLELLTEFDRICRKNGLKYNISFGTLLGAVRHKGFIPWDDDIDVTMPWKDYAKLDEAIKNDLDGEKYYYRTPESEENNHLIFKHLERKGTLYTKPGRGKLKQQIGVFIDIFPMYPAAPNSFLDWFHARICRFWRTALWATIGAESEPKALKRCYYKLIARPGNKVCYEKFLKAATFFQKEDKNLKFWIAMDRNPYKVALVDMDNYNNTIEMEFEGRSFLAPANYEAVLYYCFGVDWKMYPPIRSRKAAHNAIIEMNDLYQYEEGT